jgi:hypothetical protein
MKMTVVIDSGEIPSAIGKTGKPLYSVVSKWQQKVNIGFNVSAEWLLAILREVDEHEVWKEWGSSSRDAFIADVLMLDYSVVEKAVPEIIQRVTSGEVVMLEKEDGTKFTIKPATSFHKTASELLRVFGEDRFREFKKYISGFEG